MKQTRLSPLKALVSVLLLVCSAFPSQRARASAGYVVKEFLDSTTPIPGQPGQTFANLGDNVEQVAVTDGTTVAFTLASSDPVPNSVWSVPIAGGTPTRLADTNSIAPGANAGAFTQVQVRGIGGGMAVFVGEFSGGVGLYSVPLGGGAITKLVDTNTTVPSSTAVFTFYQDLQSVAVHGAQVLFAADSGLYFVPVAGGAITRFADSTTPVVDPSGTQCLADDFAGVGGAQQADFGGGTVAFLPTYTNDFAELFTGPATGLTAGANGVADNDTFVAGLNTPVPGGSGAGFDPQSFDALVDDSGTPVFFGSASDGSSFGIYSSVNGGLVALADNFTNPPGVQSFAIFGRQKLTAVSDGTVYFYAQSELTDTKALVQGVYSVPVAGGSIVPVVVTGDFLEGSSGAAFAELASSFGGAAGGKVVFYGTASNSGTGALISGLFVATAVGIAPSGSGLTLSTQTGGNAGPATVTATIGSADPSIVSGATVKLTAKGHPDIAGARVAVNAAGTSLTATFNLNGAALETYDFIITNPDGGTISQAAAFTVEAATGPVLYHDLIGRNVLRAGQPQAYTIVVGNSGDIDAGLVPVFITYPSYVTAQLVTPVATLPQPLGATQFFDYSQIPVTAPDGDQNALPLILPLVPAGSVVTVQVLLSSPDVPQYAHTPFTITVANGQPLIDTATGMPPADDYRFTSGEGLGEHTEAAGLAKTCFLGLFNVLVDCGGAAFPPLAAAVTCSKGIAITAATIYANLASDNATATTTAISYYQSEASFFITLVDCAVKITPGVGTIINVIQCGFDTYSLLENCVSPTLFSLTTVVSGDPNDLVGSPGDGSPKHYLTGSQPLRYAVYFENEATASAPAQAVTISNPLDANLNLNTFSLGPIGFGSTLLNPPAGSQSYSTVVDLRPATNLLVRVTAALNTAARSLSYSFQSLDPATNQPPTDPTIGFLPPDVNAPAGDGFVTYFVKPKGGLATGTSIKDQASIVFDVNAPIATPIWTNTLDNTPPKSEIKALPKIEKHADINLHVTGSDQGSGVKFYNIYVSEDHGSFQPAIEHAAGPKITYTGVTGHKYGFIAQAVDEAGNVERLKTSAEASTEIRGADLVGAWVGHVSIKTAADGVIKLTGELKVSNQSPQVAASGASFVRFYLSNDGTFSLHDPVVGRDVPFRALGADGAIKLALEDAKLRAGTSIKGKYLIAVIDPDKTIPETDTTNNVVVYGPFP